MTKQGRALFPEMRSQLQQNGHELEGVCVYICAVYDDPARHTNGDAQAAGAATSSTGNAAAGFLKKGISPIKPHWFPSHSDQQASSVSSSSAPYTTQSYQSGGIPSAGTSYGSSSGAGSSNLGGFRSVGESVSLGGGLGLGAAVANPYAYDDERENAVTMWETRFGLRVDVLAAFAYLLGPVSALICLILETHNDFVRFHAYQSAILTTPILFFRIFGSLVGFASFLNSLLTWTLILLQLYMAFRAYIDASRNNLSRFYVPYIGTIAEQFVAEE